MVKKIYFSFSSVLQILLAIFIIVNASVIVQAQLDSLSEIYSMFPADFQERIVSLLTNGGPKFFIITSIVSIVLNLIVLKEALTNNLLKKKGKIIALSVFSFLSAQHIFSMFLSLVNFIVILCLKRKNPEDYPDEKKEIPKLEHEKSSKKEIILTIVLLLVYYSQYITHLFKSEINALDLNVRICINIGIYIVLLILSIFIFKSKLKKDIKLFKENVKAYYQFVLPRFGIMYVIFIASALVSIIITKQGTSINQQTLDSLPLWFTIPAAVLYAPIVEELVFRGSIRRFIRNDVVFIIISAVLFGLLHTVGSEVNILNTFVMALPYTVLGAFFAYIYSKTNNLCTNMLCHAFQNILALTLSSLLMFAVI